MVIAENTLDDLLQTVMARVRSHGKEVVASKGSMLEVVGVLLVLTNPRARFSVSETRGRLFSALGEFCWYLAATDNLDVIEYYLPGYNEFADGTEVYGAYGPRLFGANESREKRFGRDQIQQIISILEARPTSRQAVIQLFDSEDILEKHNHVPCTCTLQFMVRDGRLQLIVTMRSNDIYLGLPHDVFAFTMLQELVARSLKMDVGIYRHFVGSLHLYDKNAAFADDYLSEGWQSSETRMPNMPDSDPWPAVAVLRIAEEQMRNTGAVDQNLLIGLDDYWADIVRLLQIFGLTKRGKRFEAEAVANAMSTDAYDVFIQAKLGS